MFSLPKVKGINGYYSRFKKVRVLVGQTDTVIFMVGWYEVQFKCPLKIPVHSTLTTFTSTPSICCHSMRKLTCKYKFQHPKSNSQILSCKFHQSTGLCPCVEARLPKWWFGGGGRPTVAIRSPHHYNPEPWFLCEMLDFLMAFEFCGAFFEILIYW